MLKRNRIILKIYSQIMLFLKAYMPSLRAKIAYRITYGKNCNLQNPKTFSEKLLWLSLHTYRNNPLILDLCDKYKVRDFVSRKAGEDLLNELYFVFPTLEDISYDKLPNSFALKISQGCTTNLLCKDKASLNRRDFTRLLQSWKKKQYLYDKMMADIGGVSVPELDKCYICEKYLVQPGHSSPTDYKIYCFNGIPRAILVITDRFKQKHGMMMMSVNWDVIGCPAHYQACEQTPPRPKSLNRMLQTAQQLSEGFPFVRVDMYDIAGKPIFGEMTFFPNGCINTAEINIDGKYMGELLDISREIAAIHKND